MLSRRGFFTRLAATAALVALAGVIKVYPPARKWTFAEMVTRTLRANNGKLADNIMQTNALFQRLSDKS